TDLVSREEPTPPAPRPDGPPAWSLPIGSERRDEEVGFRDLIATLRRRWGIVGSIALLCVAAAGTVAWLQEPSYRSGAVIRLVDMRSGIMGGLDVATPDALGTPDPLLSQMQVLQSATVLNEVVEQEGLRLEPLTRGLTLSDFEEVLVSPGARPDTMRFAFESGGFDVSFRGGL